MTASPNKSAPIGGRERPNTPSIKVSLTGVAETLLIPLLGRVLDAEAEHPILGDSHAKEVIRKLDYDFAKLPVPPTHAAGVALRTSLYDGWAASFLNRHTCATVLHLACGLDSRNQRVKWTSPEVRWIDVELPEVVAIRRQVLPTTLPGQEYQLVEADITDAVWLEHIPTDRPVLVIMEGLVSYLQEHAGRTLISRLVSKLKEGELHFDCMNASVLKATNKQGEIAVSKTGTTFQWAIDDLKSLEDIHPSLKMLEAIRYLDLAPGVGQLGWQTRASFYLLSWLPSLRDSVRFVRFGFSDQGFVKPSR
ncbi:polyketide synthesis O-methyltransferase [Xylariaceae sp. FL1272]|nr:polyketide synthesis O-methyltransferase [Xylariaceae sp. FL1272]